MVASERRLDPEIARLTQQVRALVNQAHRLSQDIGSTVDELREHADAHIRLEPNVEEK